ncbi:hypothetical protein NMY22_g16068 [Coprinellus aureogranulatus]|nr:hypothetical protein NMY22_g16068 [Coprinellus aureogranulatus]
MGQAGAGGGLKLQRPTAKRLASSVLESGNAKAMKFDDAPQSPAINNTTAPTNALPVQPLGSVNSLPPISSSSFGGGGDGAPVYAPTNKPGAMLPPAPRARRPRWVKEGRC